MRSALAAAMRRLTTFGTRRTSSVVVGFATATNLELFSASTVIGGSGADSNYADAKPARTDIGAVKKEGNE